MQFRVISSSLTDLNQSCSAITEIRSWLIGVELSLGADQWENLVIILVIS